MGLYDIEYGIAKYSDLISNPLLKVSAHPTENVEDDGRFDLSYRKYVDSDVYGQTGISFDKALEMPSFRFNRLCNLAAKSAKKRSDATQDVLNTAARQAGFPTK